MATPREIAEWMLEELKDQTILCQEVVAHEISMQFGEEFTYTSAGGTLAVDERVLSEFRAMTGNTVVSIKGERFWRLKQP